jgi:hypothetical protein
VSRLLKFSLLLSLFAIAGVSSAPADEREPIATIGHGGFFDSAGKQIVPTADFVAKAEAWYRHKLAAALPAEKKARFLEFEKRLRGGLALEGQDRLIAEARALEWLAANSPAVAADGRTLGKIRALEFVLNWQLPERADLKALGDRPPYRVNPALAERLRALPILPTVFLATTNQGQAYLNECANAQVPIPPRINDMDPNGTAGWRSVGFIPQAEQFIIGSPAEVRVFQDSNGMCIALPRYSDASLSTVALDGVICLSKITSKVCIWDNQMNGTTFSFPAGTKVPIGVPASLGGLYQAGGYELLNGQGGVCTDCHAGENPYIIHPNANLGGGVLMGSLASPPFNLPMFAPNRYDPIVPAVWPQNQLSMTPAYVPPVCNGCHAQGGAGRFPHLSTDLPDYCGTILQQAIASTMPPGSPGSQVGTPAVNAFTAFCGTAPTSGPSDRGDPHLTTTNGINYDFQAGGEFTALRNSDTGFELQTRQTPVTTSFVPGANAYTGLATCVSLNTAAAIRVGGHRITYQPARGDTPRPEQMQLRIDGSLVSLPAAGVGLGSGNRIAHAASGGGIDVRLKDGTHLVITPNFWSSEGYWYLNVEVLNTPAREGTMGHIAGGNWLPYAPNGSSFGPAPVGIPARYTLLNKTFADAWRVTPTTSLFDYPAGFSTASFTDRDWPPKPGSACVARVTPWGPGQDRSPPHPMKREDAARLCRVVRDKAVYQNCVLDLTAMGDPGVLASYLATLKARQVAMGAP